MSDEPRPLALDDCVCPVCLEIFLEPVTLPCTHTFCQSCFLESLDKSTLCCPMCRKRVSTWVRHNSRSNTLVNQPLWQQVQAQFPERCQRRLSGQDTVSRDHLEVFFPRVSQPGEVRQEYQEQVSRLREEQRLLDQEQAQASEAYISQLLQEEERHLQEEQRRREADEQLARVISQQLNSQDSGTQNQAAKKTSVCGQMDRFLCPVPPRPAPLTSAPKGSSHKENQHGPEAAQPPPVARTQQPLLDRNHQVQTADRSKRKLCEMDGEEAELVTEHAPSLPEVLAERETALWQRRQQEDEDRRVALLLQKQLDKELQSATDRRKGSADAYQLRRQERGRPAPSSPPHTSGRGGRQTTLTHLFPHLSS